MNEVLTRDLPSIDRRLGFVKEAYADYKPLELGDWKSMGYEKGEETRCVFGYFLVDGIVA